MNVHNIQTNIGMTAKIGDDLSVSLEYLRHSKEIVYKLRERVYNLGSPKGWVEVSPISANYVLDVFKQTDRHKQMVNVIMEAVNKTY